MTDLARRHNIVNCYDGCSCDGAAEEVVGPRLRARDAADQLNRAHELGDVEMLLALVDETRAAWMRSDFAEVHAALLRMGKVANRIRRP